LKIYKIDHCWGNFSEQDRGAILFLFFLLWGLSTDRYQKNRLKPISAFGLKLVGWQATTIFNITKDTLCDVILIKTSTSDHSPNLKNGLRF
jgi:hypothetical protein